MIVLGVLCTFIVRDCKSVGEKNLDYIIVLGAQVYEHGPSAILKYRKQSIVAKTTGNILLGGVVAILFINLTAWTYESSVYFACLGTIIGATKTDKRKLIKS